MARRTVRRGTVVLDTDSEIEDAELDDQFDLMKNQSLVGSGLPNEKDSDTLLETAQPPVDVVITGTDVLFVGPAPDVDVEKVVDSEKVVRMDLPMCGCCREYWSLTSGGRLKMPSCGCAIHPVCQKCKKCGAHCEC